MLEKLFGFDRNVTRVRTEVLAGITTFLTMAYILAVNPNILSATGMDKGALFTTTVVASAFATLLMAFYAKLPFGLAPGMGLNAFFAYTVCLTMGYTWQFALTAVLIEGLIFILLTVTNLREKIVDAIPVTLKNAIGAGIGLFISFIGLQNAGIIVNNDATLISMGNITSGTALLGMIGLVVTSLLLVKGVRGALLFGILITTLIGIPMGITKFDGIFSTPPSIEPIFWQFEWHNIFTKEMIVVVFTFLFVDMFDTIGTLVGVTTKAGMMDKNGKIPHLKQAFMVDAIGTTAGAMLGTSTITTFVESASGVGEGGRSGLTSFVTAVCFLLSLFFAPFFLSVPGAATAPVLILVGLMMMSSVLKVNFADYSEAIPAFICIIFMPLAYSISDGIVLGMISYVLINLLTGKYKKLTIGMYILAAIFVLKFFV
ncbi:Probable adenine permease PurP [uncultured Bacteroides sp.]|uniref:NCS2 family permease n=1 Tax=Bacteroides cellulolyticus TaxID=2981780 RepID=UPI000821B89A|nr:NCS2 family permease [Bacteroides cellulolyticus]MCU6771329.1 NCS2 family permease [Bacteroides cellulolyticus]SCH74501.1 Probable adenine permease PurP [uncultured Bacteroides sp.]